ncbi:MAG: hypothetical protein IIA64_08675 [Planctomycetes bacterium]|nr:hypothetical protein [Planctomycetota bacterium]
MATTGTIIQVIGSTFDAQFPEEDLPEIYNAVKCEIDIRGDKTTLVGEVAKHLGGGQIRCIALAGTDGPGVAIFDNVGPGLPRTIDQSQLAASLDIFSPYVEVLDEEVVEGTSATVSFIVDHRLPAKHTKLQKLEGRWYYDPGSVDATNLPAAFRRMARGLRQVREEIESGRLSPKALRDDPERLMNEVRVRLMPGVRMLPPPPAKPEPDDG